MCGIFGYVTTQARTAESIRLADGLAALRHRGPDDRGSWTGEARGVRAGLGHARLAILDLSPAGHQPMASASGRYQIVFNGEIFNFDELRRQLEGLGHRFRSSGDTEVILQAFEEWGADCVLHLRGMYAFAVFDTQTGRLFLARDRLGVKPLYYAPVPGGVAFASEVRALLAAGEARRRTSMRAVTGYFALGSIPDPLTIIDGVHSLLPGCALEVRDGSVQTHRYWEIPWSSEGERWTFEDAAAAVRAELRDAVRIRLVSDVPLGIFLSGGIDSSALVALAAEVSHRPLHTFTVTLEDANLDEARYAADVATRFGCDHHVMHLSADRAAAEIDKAVAALDQPSSDGVNTYFVAKAAKEAGVTVALSGLGGDELFAGYPSFRYIGRLNAALDVARPALGLLPEGLPFEAIAAPLSSKLRKGAALAATRDRAAAYGVLRGLLTPEQCEHLLGVRPDPGSFVYSPAGLAEAADRGLVDAANAHSVLEISNYMRN
ncbi:MAG: asparagine synthase (glutamine-hydrolyzing), partial [Myxococcales bacterium]